MIMSIIYFILAGLALSFLVLIHELGHYIVARRNGIRVEVFSVGFGRPIIKWKMDGVEWRICWILFGGYVKPAGLDREGNVDPHDVEGGFYHSTPWARIKVAAMGPIVNIVFAFILFGIIWLCGGRAQPFSKHTKLVGYIDPNSELFINGIRPGDEIDQIDGRKFRGFQDLMYSAVTAKDQVTLKGQDINYYSSQKTPFEMSIASYPDPRMNDASFKTFGILHPARYLIYDDFASKGDNLIAESSPMFGSGIQSGDRIVWVNGNLIFSVEQLAQILNKQTTLITVVRDGKQINVEVPKFRLRDLRFTRSQMAEIDDWQHELNLKGDFLDNYFIPYSLNGNGVVQNEVHYIDDNSNELALDSGKFLRKGDKIIAVDSQKVYQSYQVLAHMQKKMANVIVQRNEKYPPLSWKSEDRRFIDSVNYKDLTQLVAMMDVTGAEKSKGNLVLLNPIEPLSQSNFVYSKEQKVIYDEKMSQVQKQINEIKDVKKRQVAIAQFEAMKNQRMLGVALQDRQVIYNPNPFNMVGHVFADTYRTLSSLVTGNLSPKWLSGPVGFVQVMHHGWSVGYKEALYWMGVISMGLGIFNLLPIPALDGGHIGFSLYEMISRKKVSVKVMERMVLPFAILLICLILFVTFQDVLRIFK
ncbi:MAG: site-2 protease family protein [Rhabdochlamydiaceae bacterium]|nr:site-2 protease family protein [Candidatus Amphrikana amoebophyrae]